MKPIKLATQTFLLICLFLTVSACEPGTNPETATNDDTSVADVQESGEDLSGGAEGEGDLPHIDIPDPGVPTPEGPDDGGPAGPGPDGPGTPDCDRVQYEKRVDEDCPLPNGGTGRSTWTMKCWSDGILDMSTGKCASTGENEICEANPIRTSACKPALSQVLGE